MNIFIAGATGAIGRVLVRQLVNRGHHVVGMTRSPSKIEMLQAMGAAPVVADALDPDAVGRAIGQAEPDVIVHQLTALADSLTERNYNRLTALTNRLRTEGTDHLLAAARAAGVRRFVAQSYAGTGVPFQRTGGWIKTEQDPLDPEPPTTMKDAFAAIAYLERTVSEADGTVLRYGSFYGPGTSLGLDPDGQHVDLIRKRRMPVIGGGTGVWSFIHIEDAAAATVAAIEQDAKGIYNIVDDEPAAVSEWLPVLAEAIDAPQPWSIPAWLGRLIGGEAIVTVMTEGRGASNAKARRELGWVPQYPSWRSGFREGLRESTPQNA